MKTLATFSVATLASILLTTEVARAADADVPQSLFESRGSAVDEARETEAVDEDRFIWHHGWYVAPTVGVTQLDRDAAATYGLRAVWRANRKYGFGLAVTGMELERDEGLLEMGYGGLVTEYVVHSNQLVHLVLGSTVGGGAWCNDPDGDSDGDSADRCGGGRGFFVSEPNASVELNLTSFMRLNVGAGYRFVIASEKDGIGASELGGFAGRAALELGRF